MYSTELVDTDMLTPPSEWPRPTSLVFAKSMLAPPSPVEVRRWHAARAYSSALTIGKVQ